MPPCQSDGPLCGPGLTPEASGTPLQHGTEQRSAAEDEVGGNTQRLRNCCPLARGEGGRQGGQEAVAPWPAPGTKLPANGLGLLRRMGRIISGSRAVTLLRPLGSPSSLVSGPSGPKGAILTHGGLTQVPYGGPGVLQTCTCAPLGKTDEPMHRCELARRGRTQPPCYRTKAKWGWPVCMGWAEQGG